MGTIPDTYQQSLRKPRHTNQFFMPVINKKESDLNEELKQQNNKVKKQKKNNFKTNKEMTRLESTLTNNLNNKEQIVRIIPKNYSSKDLKIKNKLNKEAFHSEISQDHNFDLERYSNDNTQDNEIMNGGRTNNIS